MDAESTLNGADRAAGSGVPTVAEVIASALERHGVPLTFGQSLPSAVQLAATDIGIRQVAYRTENAGAYMADGYARVSGRVGVVTAQNGPAATLLVAGLAEALKASVPMVALVQEVPRAHVDRNAFQELGHEALFRGVAKWVRRLPDPDRVEDYIDMAFAAATSGRPGPAVLLLPVDLLTAPVEGRAERTASLGAYPLDRPVADPEAVEAAADLLAQARHALVVAGGGVHLSGAAAALAELQERAALPVATTVAGKGGVAETHPLSVGVVGYFMGPGSATRAMRPLVDRADVVLLIGTRTNQNGTDTWSLFPQGARFVHLDMDPEEIGRNYEALRLAGDARATLTALLRALARRDLSRRERARAGLEREIAAARAAHAEEIAPVATSERSPLRPERLMADLARVLTPESIVAADASYSSIWVANGLIALAPGMRLLAPRGLAGLGWGLPMAMGAKLARPDRPVFAVVGDGGFAHVWSELETACRMDIPVVVTVLNNGVLGYQKDAEDMKLGRHTDACAFAPVDHARIAEACGCLGLRVDRAADYAEALQEGLAADRPTVIDVATDPMAYPPITFFDDARLAEIRRARGEPER